MPVGLASGTEECYRQFREKTRKQYYLSILVERLTGKDPKAIAESLHLTERSVRRALDYVRKNLSLLADPGNGATRKAKRPSSTSRIKMLEAKCEGCGALIPKGIERMVLAGFAVRYRAVDDDDYDEAIDSFDEYGDGYVTHADLRGVAHYCNSCKTEEELRVRNPWSAHWSPEQIQSMKDAEAEGQRQAAAEGERLSTAVAAGDMHAFNKAMPTTPKWTDVMARAFSGRAPNKESEKGTVAGETLRVSLGGADDETISPSEAFDNLASTDSPDRPSVYLHGAAARAAGEVAQRAKLLAFLNSPASRSKFMPNKRKALKMWAEGVSQPEVARLCGIDQGNFSRMKNAALAEAHKA